jgi:hypothetical protein
MGLVMFRLANHAGYARLKLDKTDLRVLSDTELMRSYLSDRLGVEVMNFHITELNYDNDPAHINLFYRNQENLS